MMNLMAQAPESNARNKVHDTVYVGLRRALMAGRYEPGHVFTMDAVATVFGTSHMPVREALRRLVAESALVVMRSNGSTIVPLVDLAQLEDIFRSRVVVERAAVEAATVLHTDEDIDVLEELAARHRDMASTGDAYGMLELNQIFHFRLYDCARSPISTRLIEVLWLSMGPYMRLLSQEIDQRMRAGDKVYAGVHDDIIAGLRARDAVFAGDAITADIRGTQRLLSNVLAGLDAREGDAAP